MAGRTSGDELAYALVTPYSLHKSRTGGILARLLWADVELVAARMYAPRPESGFIEEYCDAIYDPEEKDTPLRYQRMLIEYVLKNFGQPNVRGISNRLALLVFRGPDAVRQISRAVGGISEHVQGDTVRGTYGDYFREESARLERYGAFRARLRLMDKYERLYQVDSAAPRNDFFEPAVLTGTTPAMNEAHLKLFRKYAYGDGGFVMHAIDGLSSAAAETSMVILKPESFRNRNPLPGNLIDFFARVGMFITGMKVLELSVEEAREFYGLKVPQFREQLKGMVADRARRIVAEARMLSEQAVGHLGASHDTAGDPRRALDAARALEDFLGEEPGPTNVKSEVVDRVFEVLGGKLTNLEPTDALYEEIAEELKDLNAQAEFEGLIRYMTGKDPGTGEPLEAGQRTRCMAILYSGDEALSVIRKRLKEMREVYGQNVLQNRAHASDPEEDPVKEVTVLGMPNSPKGESRPCDVERVVREAYGLEQPD
jgi:nucleoside diphosphate kinase